MPPKRSLLRATGEEEEKKKKKNKEGEVSIVRHVHSLDEPVHELVLDCYWELRRQSAALDAMGNLSAVVVVFLLLWWCAHAFPLLSSSPKPAA